MLGFNDPTNGLRDIVDYVERLKPKVFYPDPPRLRRRVRRLAADEGRDGARDGAARGQLPTEMRWLYDPIDYLRPGLMTFDPAAERWGGSGCMSERLRVRASGIGDLRLGAAAGPAATRTLRYCVGEPENEAVSAVTDGQGSIRLVATTAPEHRARGVGERTPCLPRFGAAIRTRCRSARASSGPAGRARSSS